MPLTLSSLRAAASRYDDRRLYESLAKTTGETAFLCHSHKDSELAKGLQVQLKEAGWKLYIDWQDATMPTKTDRTTAEKIQKKIKEAKLFFFLATPNSVGSLWCPWEIGYADGVKSPDKIKVIPTIDENNNWYGTEYMQLYQSLDRSTSDKIVFNPPTSKTSILQALMQ
jgi:hypothetical protein